MSTQSLPGFGALLLLVSAASAQLDLAGLYTQTVKTGQPWAAINTKVDRLAMRITVDRGVVTTTATLEYTPGNGVVNEWVCPPQRCDRLTGKCEQDPCASRIVKDTPLDSLETSTGFSLEDNAVLTDMHLWVGDVKVKADLQERALASAQYEDIVKRRKDPALLETWGNGNYNLRIFPNESGKSRRIEIEFVQGMEDHAGSFRAALPLLHRLAKVAGAVGADPAKWPNRTMASVHVTALSLDGKTYRLEWGGLGNGDVGPVPLQLVAADLAELKEGVLSAPAAACAGCLTPWITARDGLSWFGVKARLDAKSVAFEAEPGERHFLLDVDTKDTLVASRARKVALLSLKAYGAAPHSANLSIADGRGGLVSVFPAAVPMDADALRKAYEALRAWTPVGKADAHATLKAFAKSRPAPATPVVAYLVNDDSTAWYPWVSGSTQAAYEAWEKARAAVEDETLIALQGARVSVFGFWNDYRLNRLATATGGFQVGSLFGYIYFPMRGGVVADIAPDRPKDLGFGIHLPPLFGPGRPDAWSIADLKVTASGIPVEDMVVLQSAAPRYYGLMMDGPVTMDVARSDLMAPTSSSPDTIALRISGRYQGSGKVTLKVTVTGLWGGLRFAKEYHADLPVATGAGAAGAAIWAGQQGEALGRASTAYDPKAVQKLGRDFHIVNRQMSLLALEPGMDLWTELPTRNGGGDAGTGGRDLNAGAPIAGDSKPFSGQNAAGTLDQVSLEEILSAGVGVVRRGPARGGEARPALCRIGSGWTLVWEARDAGLEAAVFQVFEPSGRAVAELQATRRAEGYVAEWKHPGRPGLYYVIARAGSRTGTAKVLLRP